ncbi:MAG TPA: PP2C family protein-serine/threonine phosphatase [Anaerolineales bacterium]|nr:PP2C family protein-serine/threonine phosphatase [Anaerolineales bacterium]
MKTKLYDEIQIKLKETRENLTDWVETTPEEKRHDQLGPEGEKALEEHLHVIDTSLEKIEEGTFGICKICHEPVDSELLQVDYTSAVCLGHFSDEEIRQLESELALSQVIQRGLLPQQVPEIDGLNIAAFSRPAQIVGGDYFDFVDFQDGKPGLVMADVSGHGVSAGMFMSSMQTAFHTLVPQSDSPVDVLERLNHLYIHNINFTTFVTIFFGKYDPSTRTLSYANAGHSSAYLYRVTTNQEIWLRPTGPAIGISEGFTIRREDIRLEPGDILLLYTDGITEAADHQGDLWGEDNLADIIRQNPDSSAERLIQKILTALKTHTNGSALADDVTLMISRVS